MSTFVTIPQLPDSTDLDRNDYVIIYNTESSPDVLTYKGRIGDVLDLINTIDSVNGKTGSTITLTPDDFNDSTTLNKFVTANDKNKIAIIRTDQGSGMFLAGDGVYRSAGTSIGNNNFTVNTISERDLLTGLSDGDRVLVIDASSDPDVLIGAALYYWNSGTGSFGLIADSISIDFTVSGLTNSFHAYTGTTAPNTFLAKNNFNVYSGLTNTLINSKVSATIFNWYSGTTVPNTYQSKSSISTLTGTTLPTTFQSKTSMSTYTGTTAPNQFASRSTFLTFTGTTAPSTYVSKSNYNAFTANTVTSGNNGLTKSGSNVRLGGSLTGDTSITGGYKISNNLNGVEVNQNALSSGFLPAFKITPGSHSLLTANTEFPNVTVEAITQKWASSVSLPIQRNVWFKSPTLTAVAGSQITTPYNVYIDAPIIGSGFTNTQSFYALGVNGASNFVGSTYHNAGVNTNSIRTQTTTTPVVFTVASNSATGLQIAGVSTFQQTSGTVKFIDIIPGNASSGTSSIRYFNISPALQGVSTGTLMLSNLSPSTTKTGGDLIAYNYTPSNLNVKGKHYAFKSTAGGVSLQQESLTGSTGLALLGLTGGTHKNLVSSTELTDVYFNLNRTVGFIGGAKTLQRAMRITAPTYSATTATVIQRATTLSIGGAPTGGTNVVIGSSYALDIENGKLKVGSFTPGSGGTASILTNGEVRATSGFNLRDPVTSDNIFVGLKLNGSNPAIYHATGAVATFNGVGGSTTGGNYVAIAGTINPSAGSGSLTTLITMNNQWVPSAGSNSFTNINIQPTYNASGTWSGVVRGIDYNPAITNATGITSHYGLLIRPAAALSGFGLGAATLATATVDLGASTNAQASLRLRSGTAPTSPNDGDIWYDGTNLKMRIGGTTKTFTLT